MRALLLIFDTIDILCLVYSNFWEKITFKVRKREFTTLYTIIFSQKFVKNLVKNVNCVQE